MNGRIPLVDLDGVLADFAGGACELHGRPLYAVTKWNWYEDWGYSSRDFWHPIEQAGFGFYTNYVQPHAWHSELLRLLHSYGPFSIVTANPMHPGLTASKVEWINRHIGAGVQVIMGGANNSDADPRGNWKALLAHRGVLIDDCDENVKAFRAAGGLAITFPQPWNANHGVVKHRMEYVTDSLAYFMNKDTAA